MAEEAAAGEEGPVGVIIPRRDEAHRETMHCVRGCLHEIVELAAEQIYLNQMDALQPSYAVERAMQDMMLIVNAQWMPRQSVEFDAEAAQQCQQPAPADLPSGVWACEPEPEPSPIDSHVRWGVSVRKPKPTPEQRSDAQSQKSRPWRGKSRRTSTGTTRSNLKKEVKTTAEGMVVETVAGTLSPGSSAAAGSPPSQFDRPGTAGLMSTAQLPPALPLYASSSAQNLHKITTEEEVRRREFTAYLKEVSRKKQERAARAKSEQEFKDALEKRRRAVAGKEVLMDAYADGGMVFLEPARKAPMFTDLDIAVDGALVRKKGGRRPAAKETTPPKKQYGRAPKKGKKKKKRKSAQLSKTFSADELSRTFIADTFNPMDVFPTVALIPANQKPFSKTAPLRAASRAPSQRAAKSHRPKQPQAAQAASQSLQPDSDDEGADGGPGSSSVNFASLQRNGGGGSSNNLLPNQSFIVPNEAPAGASPPRLPKRTARRHEGPKRAGGPRGDAGQDSARKAEEDEAGLATQRRRRQRANTANMEPRKVVRASPQVIHRTVGMRARPYRERHPHAQLSAHATASADALQYVINSGAVPADLVAQTKQPKQIRAAVGASRAVERHMPSYMQDMATSSAAGSGSLAGFGTGSSFGAEGHDGYGSAVPPHVEDGNVSMSPNAMKLLFDLQSRAAGSRQPPVSPVAAMFGST